MIVLVSFSFIISFESNYYFGTGIRSYTGINKITQFDNNNPYIPATEIIGYWRKRCFEYFDNIPDEYSDVFHKLFNFNNKKSSYEWVEFFFGNSHSQKEFIVSNALKIKQLINYPLSVRAGIRINKHARVVEGKQLYFNEVGQKGDHYNFHVEFLNDNINKLTLLVWILKSVNELGSKINRGYGSCKIEFEDSNYIDPLATAYNNLLTNQTISKDWQKIFDTNNQENSNDILNEKIIDKKLESNSIIITIRILEPTILGMFDNSSKIAKTEEYISGIKILGAINSLISHYNVNYIDKLISGGIRFSPLYPYNNEHIYFPSPFHLLNCNIHPISENANQHIIDSYHYQKNLSNGCQEKNTDNNICGGKLKKIRKMIAIKEKDNTKDSIYYDCYDVKKSITLHNHLKKNQVPDLYDYEHINPNQVFSGIITFDNINAIKEFFDAIHLNTLNTTFKIKLGKSYTRGFGLAEVKLSYLSDTVRNLWMSKLNPHILKETQEVSIFFLSPTILIDTFQRNIVQINKDCNTIIAKWFGFPIDKIDADSIISFLETQEYSGYNSLVGIPRLHDFGIKEGSVIFFKLKQDLSQEELKNIHELQTRGIGLRCNEGFGRIAYHHPLIMREIQQTTPIDLPLVSERESIKINLDDKDFESFWNNTLFTKQLTKNDQDLLQTLIFRLSTHKFLNIEDIIQYLNSYNSEKKISIQNYSPQRSNDKFSIEIIDLIKKFIQNSWEKASNGTEKEDPHRVYTYYINELTKFLTYKLDTQSENVIANEGEK